MMDEEGDEDLGHFFPLVWSGLVRIVQVWSGLALTYASEQKCLLVRFGDNWCELPRIVSVVRKHFSLRSLSDSLSSFLPLAPGWI